MSMTTPHVCLWELYAFDMYEVGRHPYYEIQRCASCEMTRIERMARNVMDEPAYAQELVAASTYRPMCQCKTCRRLRAPRERG